MGLNVHELDLYDVCGLELSDAWEGGRGAKPLESINNVKRSRALHTRIDLS